MYVYSKHYDSKCATTNGGRACGLKERYSPVKAICVALIAVPVLTSQVMVNGASGSSAVSLGSFIAVYGSFPTPLGQASSYPWPTATTTGFYIVDDTGLPTNATRLPLLYWSPSQINALLTVSASSFVLRGPAGGGADVPYAKLSANIQSQAPGIFVASGTDCSVSSNGCSQQLPRGIITDANYNVISSLNPAKPGQGLVIWCTGVRSGPSVTVIVGGITASVFYSGQTTELGLDQVNFIVPSGLQISQTCIRGEKIEVQLAMRSITSGVISNALSLPVALTSCN